MMFSGGLITTVRSVHPGSIKSCDTKAFSIDLFVFEARGEGIGVAEAIRICARFGKQRSKPTFFNFF